VSCDPDHAVFRDDLKSAGWFGRATINLQTKFKVSNYTHYEDMREVVQNVQIGVLLGT